MSKVKAGGKRVVKKGVEEGATHVTPEKDSKKADHKPRYVLLFRLASRLNLFTCSLSGTNQNLCSRSLATPNRMQQVGILLTGSLDKVKEACFVFSCRDHIGLCVYNIYLCPHSWATTFQRRQWVWDIARCALLWRSPTALGAFSFSSPGNGEVASRKAKTAVWNQLWDANKSS